MARGRLLVFEGVEGAGKSTQAARLHHDLEAAGHDVCLVREPGGTVLGERIRALLLAEQGEMTPAAEALLFMASRAELVNRVIRPALDRGAIVIADRFFLSTYAYQSGGRKLPEQGVREANALATGGLIPDLTLLLRMPADVGLARAAERGGADRMERAGNAFHQRVAEAFRAAESVAWQGAHPECGPVVAIDAGGSEEEVAVRVRNAVSAGFPDLTIAAEAGAS
ncbi:MAG TPA: dTMP kinase [Gemmatimonadaceae bacterium]|nr:dTMP kinase [Gemmatimonadaceae bacterium]